jgi:hypothetical protein
LEIIEKLKYLVENKFWGQINKKLL